MTPGPGRGSTTIWLLAATVSLVLLVSIAAASVYLSSVAAAYPLLMVGWPIVGGLVILNRPDNPVGRLLVAFGFVISLAFTSEAYLYFSVSSNDLSSVDLAAWVAGWAYVPMPLIIMSLAAVFPSGRMTSLWMRWPFRIATVITSLAVLGRMFAPIGVSVGVDPDLVNPWGVEALAPYLALDPILTSLVLGLLAVAVVDLVIRWRRSNGVERLQMRWLALAAGVFVAMLLVTSLLRLTDLPQETLIAIDNFGWLSGLAVLPLGVGVAVTRYRLYEIDRIISRTITYGLMVILLASVYALGVFFLRDLLPLEGPLPVAGSTLAVAAIFNPLRRRVRGWVDRRFNRGYYDAQRVMDGFAASLRDELDADRVVTGWMEVVSATMQPEKVGVWVR